MGWIKALFRALFGRKQKPVLAPPVEPEVDHAAWLQQRHQEELDRSVALTLRRRELEAQRKEQIRVTEWQADGCEMLRRDLDALLKAQGTETGTQDPELTRRFQSYMAALAADPERPAARERCHATARQKLGAKP